MVATSGFKILPFAEQSDKRPRDKIIVLYYTGVCVVVLGEDDNTFYRCGFLRRDCSVPARCRFKHCLFIGMQMFSNSMHH